MSSSFLIGKSCSGTMSHRPGAKDDMAWSICVNRKCIEFEIPIFSSWSRLYLHSPWQRCWMKLHAFRAKVRISDCSERIWNRTRWIQLANKANRCLHCSWWHSSRCALVTWQQTTTRGRSHAHATRKYIHISRTPKCGPLRPYCADDYVSSTRRSKLLPWTLWPSGSWYFVWIRANLVYNFSQCKY